MGSYLLGLLVLDLEHGNVTFESLLSSMEPSFREKLSLGIFNEALFR